jgi:hypothetical protein
MSNIRVSAKYRDEPDYGKLARALLLFLEAQGWDGLADGKDSADLAPSPPDAASVVPDEELESETTR